MKLLMFVDMHGSERALKEIKQKAKNVDVIVCAGDISIFQEKLDFFLSELNKTEKPVFIVPGNHEDEEELRLIAGRFKNVNFIHNASYEFGEYLFLGYGGGGFSENYPMFEDRLSKFIDKVLNHKNAILVTHAPPYKTKLDFLADRHIGSKSLRKFIEKTQPRLLVCGHLHENEGMQDYIGKTRMINPGYKGMIINL